MGKRKKNNNRGNNPISANAGNTNPGVASPTVPYQTSTIPVHSGPTTSSITSTAKGHPWTIAIITIIVNGLIMYSIPFLESYLQDLKEQKSAIPYSEMVKTDLLSKINMIKDTFHPEDISIQTNDSGSQHLYKSYKDLQQNVLNLTMLEEIEDPVFSIDESFSDSLSVVGERITIRQKYKYTIENIFSSIYSILGQLDSISPPNKNFDSSLIMQKYRYSKAKMDSWITLHDYQTNHLMYRYKRCYIQHEYPNKYHLYGHKTSDTMASILNNSSDNMIESNYIKNDFYGFIMSFNEFMTIYSRNKKANLQ